MESNSSLKETNNFCRMTRSLSATMFSAMNVARKSFSAVPGISHGTGAMVTWAEMSQSPGHVFYDRLQRLLGQAGFDTFVEETCKRYYAPRMGAKSITTI